MGDCVTQACKSVMGRGDRPPLDGDSTGGFKTLRVLLLMALAQLHSADWPQQPGCAPQEPSPHGAAGCPHVFSARTSVDRLHLWFQRLCAWYLDRPRIRWGLRACPLVI